MQCWRTFHHVQLTLFNDNIKLAANLLNRCPSCMSNLVRHICEFTCSPHQSTFVNVIETKVNPANSRKLCIGEQIFWVDWLLPPNRIVCGWDWRSHHWAIHHRSLQVMQECSVSVVGSAGIGSHVRWLGSFKMHAGAMVRLHGRCCRQQLRAIPNQLSNSQHDSKSWWLHAARPESHSMQFICWCKLTMMSQLAWRW